MRILLSMIFLFLVSPAAAVRAETLPMPQGPIMLSVSGDIAKTNVGNTASFDMDMLTALPSTSFDTTTLWTDGVKSFKGVALADILGMVGVDSGTVVAMALNDYAVEIPIESIEDTVPIVAYEMDGAPMPSRQKGPLWIVYPYDSDIEYRSEVIYSRSIWQLDRLTIRKN